MRDELKDINWTTESTSCCAAEAGEEDCCEDVLSSEVHASDYQSKQLLDFQFEKTRIQDMPIARHAPADMLFQPQSNGWLYVHQQPLPPPFPIYLKNQVFLI